VLPRDDGDVGQGTAEHGDGVVRRAVVDDDHLVGRTIGEHGTDGRGRQVGALPVDDDDRGAERAVGGAQSSSSIEGCA
jgi:hypothetical protein